MFEIQTRVIINSSKENVWNCLINTREYPTWNKFITEIEGEFCKGNKVKIKLAFC